MKNQSYSQHNHDHNQSLTHKNAQQHTNQKQSSSSSVLQQTLQQIQNRVNFFSSHNISAQNSLLPNNTLTVRTISQIITPLKYFHMAETPLNLNLASIYLNEENRHTIKWAMPPPSEGEDSINEQQAFQPSFKWLSSTLIDPHLIQLDNIQPRKVEKGRVAQEWKGITEIILVNIKQKIYQKNQIKQVQNIVKRKFEKYSWLKFKRAKQIYYKGKPSVILKFSDQNSASFVYFNFMSWKSNREQFGQQCEVFRVVKDNLRDLSKLKNWVILLFRKMPLNMTKQHLMNLLTNNDAQIKWMQEFIEICGYKYTICRVSYLDEALMLCSMFNNKRIKQSKVNIHPKSSKNWRSQELNAIETEVRQVINN